MRRVSALYSGFVVAILCVGMVHVPSLRAAELVTKTDIEAQSVVVQERIVGVLREYVKYLQLSLIDKLEAQVAVLQARVSAQR